MIFVFVFLNTAKIFQTNSSINIIDSIFKSGEIFSLAALDGSFINKINASFVFCFSLSNGNITVSKS